MLNKKGQAALFDSIFFLTIVASISAGLLFFTVNYGTQAQEQLTSFYSSDFCADALKIITYINVTREGESVSSNTISVNPNIELDYLLALIKEDYADKKEMSNRTKLALKNTLESALKPFEASIDYTYYLYDEDAKKYLFLVFAIHDCTGGDCNNPVATNRVIEREFYFCTPSTSTNFLENELFPTLGKIDSSFGKVNLPVIKQDTVETKSFVMGLQVWVTKRSTKLNEIKTEPDLNCSII